MLALTPLTTFGFNLNDVGAGVSGQSDSTLDLSGVAVAGVANYMWKIVRSANIENQKDFAFGADVVVAQSNFGTTMSSITPNRRIKTWQYQEHN